MIQEVEMFLLKNTDEKNGLTMVIDTLSLGLLFDYPVDILEIYNVTSRQRSRSKDTR